MNSIRHILIYKFLIFKRQYSDLKFGGLLKNLGAFCVYAGFAAGSFMFTLNILDYLVDKVHIGSFLLHQFISMTLFICFLTISAGNVIVSYSTLYKSSEVKFLFSKPVQPANIFILKFFDNFFYSSSTLILIISSVFSAYCVYFGLGVVTSLYIFFLNILPFMFSAGAAGVILLMILVKLSTQFSFRNVVYVLVIVYMSFTVFFFNITSPVDMIDEVMKYYPDIDRYMGFLIPSFNRYLPNNWLSEVFYWINNGNFTNSIPYTILINVLFLTLSGTAILLGHKWYNSTWMAGIGNSRKNTEVSVIPKFTFSNNSFFKPVQEAILKKEFYLFLRDPSQLLHFLILTILIIIFIFSLKGIDLEDTYNYELKTILYLSMYLFNLLIITTLSLRFVFPLISLEGKEFWRIKSSPVSIGNYLNNKKKIFQFFILSAGFLLAYYPSTNIDYKFALFMSFISLSVSQVIFYINYSMGAAFLNFNEKNPIRLASSQGASLSFLFCTIFMIIVVTSTFFPVREYFLVFSQRQVYDISIFYYPLFLILLFTTISTFIIKLYLKTKYSKI